VAVRIRMKKLGRRHRSFFRVCAVDSRNPRDGRVLEELGTYDPMVQETDARAVLKGERIDYWLSVGALPSEKVRVLIKKYGTHGTHLEQQKAALERIRPQPGPVAFVAVESAESASTQESDTVQAEADPAAEPPAETPDEASEQ